MNEFSLIDQFFKPLNFKREDVLLGIGDDAACLRISPGANLLVSTDTLVSGVHFLSEWSAYDIASRAVRVNVSDLAAMAVETKWITLALTLPKIDSIWLTDFSQGLNDSLKQFNATLVGGDTTKGPLSITLTVFGETPNGQEVRRSGARPGDIILVSGKLGAAALAVKFLDSNDITRDDKQKLMNKLISPQPRVDLISFLRRYATAAIDISDGLSADLDHICKASNVGACLDKEAIPIHPLLNKYYQNKALDLALIGGDDYELCFTVPPERLDLLLSSLKEEDLVCYPIGVIEKSGGLRIKTSDKVEELVPQGYSHF